MGEILLIAADWKLRALARAQLLEQGFEVRALAATADALAFFSRGSEPPQLTVVDLQGSAAKTEHLWGLWQLTGRTPLILCTGAFICRALALQELPPANLLVRPFAVGDLVNWIKKRLA